MRPCIYNKLGGNPQIAQFHQWGHDALEGRSDEHNIMWSVAIIEFPDGKVEMVSPDSIMFTDVCQTLLEEKT